MVARATRRLLRSRAAPVDFSSAATRRGASPSPDLAVCRYLHDAAAVDFSVENFAGNTPLCHAVAYGRFEVARWLKEELRVADAGGAAENLAVDFVAWADLGLKDEEVERRSVYTLFNSLQDWRSEEAGDAEGAGEERT